MSTAVKERDSLVEQGVPANIAKKIRSLIAKADPSRNDNEHEIAVCMEKVQQYLTEYKLSIADVQSHTERDSLSGIVHTYVKMGVGQVANFAWCRELGQGVAYACYCQRLWRAKTRELCFVGEEFDTQIATELYLFISAQMKELCKVKRQEAGWKAMTSQGNKFTNEWMFGCAIRIHQRLTELRQGNDQVMALVRVADARNQAYVDKVLAPRTYVASKSGYPRGMEYMTPAMSDGFKSGDKVVLRNREGISAE